MVKYIMIRLTCQEKFFTGTEPSISLITADSPVNPESPAYAEADNPGRSVNRPVRRIIPLFQNFPSGRFPAENPCFRFSHNSGKYA